MVVVGLAACLAGAPCMVIGAAARASEMAIVVSMSFLWCVIVVQSHSNAQSTRQRAAIVLPDKSGVRGGADNIRPRPTSSPRRISLDSLRAPAHAISRSHTRRVTGAPRPRDPRKSCCRQALQPARTTARSFPSTTPSAFTSALPEPPHWPSTSARSPASTAPLPYLRFKSSVSETSNVLGWVDVAIYAGGRVP